MKEYDPHQPCKAALARAYDAASDNARIQQVLQETECGYRVLQVVRVDQYADGLRIVVR